MDASKSLTVVYAFYVPPALETDLDVRTVDGCLLTHFTLPEGEFHVDLYTLPDNLIKMLWDFTNERVPVST